MAKLFGIDIAKTVANSLKAAGNLQTCTLTHSVRGSRTSGQLTGGTNPTSTTHTCQGFVETRTKHRSGTLVAEPMSVVTIIGHTISPTVAPSLGDTVLVDGTTWTLNELIERDPASAVYEFKAES